MSALLVLGGVRAGKSRYAVERAQALGRRVALVATAEGGDAEMMARIERHRRTRPAAWTTVEAPVALAEVLRGLEGRADTVVVDCLNLWVANLFGRMPELAEHRLLAEADRLADLVGSKPFDLVLVSNEVGFGVHPETTLGRRFCDALGAVNQRIARVADEVVLLVAGCPLWLKSP